MHIPFASIVKSKNHEGWLGEKCEGIKPKRKKEGKTLQTDNAMVITRGEGGRKR